LQSLCLIHAGETTFQLGKKIQAISLSRLLEDLDLLK